MDKTKKIVLSIALLSYLLTALNNSIIITGITKIAGDLSASQVAMSWVQNAYLLAFGGCILLGGRLSDLFGRRRVLNLSLLLLGAAAALAGWSPDVAVLIAARALEGAAAAVIAPTALALLVDYFEGKERLKAIAWYSSVSGIGSCFGLLLGGSLASYASWRYGFYLDLPITIAMIGLSIYVLPLTKRVPGKFDISGTALSVAGTFSIVYAVNGAAFPLPWAAAAAMALFFFIRTEKKAEVPVMPLGLFRSRIRSGAYAARMLFTCAAFGYWYFISQFMQTTLGYSPLMASFAFLPMTASTFIAALAVPGLAASRGEKEVLLFGTIQMGLGFAWLLFADSGSRYMTAILGPMLLMGFGQGFAMSPLTNLGMHEAPKDAVGAASGLVNAAHQIGGSAGLSIMVAVTSSMPSMAAMFHGAMAVGLFFLIAMLGVSLFFPRRTGRQPEEIKKEEHHEHNGSKPHVRSVY